MRIVVLDAIPLNPGDLDWSPLRQLGDLRLHELTPPDQVNARIADADAVYTNKVKLPAAAFAAAANLRFVGVLATGYDIIDLAAARAAQVTVCNVPAYSTDSVAQATIALLLALTNHVAPHSEAVHAGRWCEVETFCFWDRPLIELAGKHLIIAGYGAIGSRVAEIGRALGMRVSAVRFAGREPTDNVPRLTIDDAFRQADVLSLHCPLTPDTQHLVNTARLALMRPSAYLINAGRGPLVDESALRHALAAGQLAGYAGDVLSVEPAQRDNPLLGAPNCIITPHLAWATFESRSRLINVSIENLQRFLAGTPQNVVSQNPR